jgi:branched-chain amino acid aminotransferase
VNRRAWRVVKSAERAARELRRFADEPHIMIHRIVHHNGHMQPIEQTRLSPGQAGLLSGWGLFTTLRVFHGVPFAFERHWRRLEKDAARTRVPFAFDAERVRGQLMELVRANEVVEGTARIYAIYNQVGFWQSDEQAPQVDLLLCTAGLPPHHEPGRLDLREHGRHAASPLAGVKVTSWLNNVWNFAEAQARGFNEVVLLNERGEAAECTAANIFCVRRGTVETPPLSAGCLEGVTRGLLLELAPQAGVPMIERTLRPADLFSADEIFITSTNRSLLGIGEIAGHIYAAAPGPVTQKLEKMFVAHMNDYVAQHAVAR